MTVGDGAVCIAFTLALAREAIPQLPEQMMSHGDGNCTYSTGPDGQGMQLAFVRPQTGKPNFEKLAMSRDTGSGRVTSVRVGDSGYCSQFAQAPAGGRLVWQRATTGLELDFGGEGVTCAEVTKVALTINASL